MSFWQAEQSLRRRWRGPENGNPISQRVLTGPARLAVLLAVSLLVLTPLVGAAFVLKQLALEPQAALVSLALAMLVAWLAGWIRGRHRQSGPEDPEDTGVREPRMPRSPLLIGTQAENPPRPDWYV